MVLRIVKYFLFIYSTVINMVVAVLYIHLDGVFSRHGFMLSQTGPTCQQVGPVKQANTYFL